ncbi:MAG: hypothetical protein NQ127_00645 [Candidatus Cardinium sp.]|nr:hypothetical protein [Candidatus Cardinium sp.]
MCCFGRTNENSTASISIHGIGRLDFHTSYNIYLEPCNSTIGEACSRIDRGDRKFPICQLLGINPMVAVV